jgi:hypothetical protein
MTTATLPDVDVLDQLDYDYTLPCEFDSDDGDCTDAAEWRMVLVITITHTLGDGAVAMLYCAAHRDVLADHLRGCGDCRHLYRITSVEPL